MQSLILDQLKSIRVEQQNGFNQLRSEFNLRLDKLVTQEAFNAEQRRVDVLLAGLGKDIADEQAARKEEMLAAQRRSDRLAVNLRFLAASVVIPVVLFIANIVIDVGGGGG